MFDSQATIHTLHTWDSMIVTVAAQQEFVEDVHACMRLICLIVWTRLHLLEVYYGSTKIPLYNVMIV